MKENEKFQQELEVLEGRYKELEIELLKSKSAVKKEEIDEKSEEENDDEVRSLQKNRAFFILFDMYVCVEGMFSFSVFCISGF